MHGSRQTRLVERTLRIRNIGVRATGGRVAEMERRLRGVLGNRNGDSAREIEAQFTERDGQAVYDDGADDQEPDDDVHDFGEALCVGALLAVDVDARPQVLEAHVEVEDCGDADGPEEADEEDLAPFPDLVNVLVHEEDDWWAPEEKDEDAEEDEAVDWYLGVVREGVPGANGAKPDEDGNVEQHIYGRLKRVVEGFLTEPVVPGEGVAGDEAG